MVSNALKVTILVVDENHDDVKVVGDKDTAQFYIIIKRNAMGNHFNLVKLPWCFEKDALSDGAGDDKGHFLSAFRRCQLPPGIAKLWEVA